MNDRPVTRIRDVLMCLVQPFSFKILLRFVVTIARFWSDFLGGRVSPRDRLGVSRVATLVLTLGPALAMGWVWHATDRSNVPAVFLHGLEVEAYITFGWVCVGHQHKVPGWPQSGVSFGVIGSSLLLRDRDLVFRFPLWIPILACMILAASPIARYRRRQRRRRGRCVECGYNLSGLTENRCPECATEYEG